MNSFSDLMGAPRPQDSQITCLSLVKETLTRADTSIKATTTQFYPCRTMYEKMQLHGGVPCGYKAEIGAKGDPNG